MSNSILKSPNQIPINSNDLINLLKGQEIKFKLYKHKPLISVKEAKSVQASLFPSNMYSVHIKNLYLRDKKKNNFLITCEQDKKIDLKLLKEKIKSDRLSFGSSDRLFQNLGVLPGAVSPFCMLNGIKKNVNFYCDYDLKQFNKIYLHPFVSDRTVCLNINDLEKFLKKHDIYINWINL